MFYPSQRESRLKRL